VVEEVDSINAFGAPGSLALKEGMQAVEVDLASPAKVYGMLVTTLTSLGRATLFFIEVNGDAVVVTL
jgi:hypothetical protein